MSTTDDVVCYKNELAPELYRLGQKGLTQSTSHLKNAEKLSTKATPKHPDESKNDFKKIHKVDVEKIKIKINDAFSSVNFVKLVCYENIFDEIKLIVVYEHDDYEYSEDTIYDVFFKLEDQFPNIYMQLIILLPSEIDQSVLNNTTTIFKRE